jgi:hypothetical protein
MTYCGCGERISPLAKAESKRLGFTDYPKCLDCLDFAVKESPKLKANLDNDWNNFVKNVGKIVQVPKSALPLKQILLLISFLILGSCSYAYSQTADCPPDKVCISREAALKALADSDTVKAQQTEIAAKDKAIADLKTELENIRREYVAASSEASALKQQAIRTDAIIDLLLKSVRPKKIGLVVF